MPTARRALLVIVLAVPALALVGCGAGGSMGLPEPSSTQADRIVGLWQGSVIVALAVGAVVWGLIVWSVLMYRRRNDDLPAQSPHNIPLEIAYTAVPLAIVIGLFGFTVYTQEKVTALAADPDLVVEVVGYRWGWEFRYPEQDVTVATEGNQGYPAMVLPVDATVRFELTTPDVNHSFWVPEFLVKRDLIQGVDNEIDVHVDRAGTWRGRCAEFCGIQHWAMLFEVRAVPQAEFDEWASQERSDMAQAS